MKRYIKTSLLAMTAVLALLSCSNDILLRESGKPADGTADGPRVMFTVGNGMARTRTAVATNYSGFAREKAINVAHSYAVVFRPDGTYYGTFALSYDDTNPESPYYHFTLGNGGYYYMYVVANTSLDLTDATTNPIASAADLFSLIETTDPGADKQASTEFLMISPKTLVDVDGNQDTSLGAVTLTRAAVRFDIDATAIDGFQITSVEISNRFKTSILARGSGNATIMTGLTKAAATETYTRGTGSGEIDASGAYVEGTSTYYVDDQQWLGVIYGYENYSEDNADVTEMTIHGTLLGVQVSHTVSFKDASTAVITKPKRNTVYTITLEAEGSGLGKGAISSNILVKDWDGTETIVYGSLEDISKPSFQVTSAQTCKDYPVDGVAATKTNPGSIVVRKSTASEITLTVKGKNIGSTLTCQGRYDNASGNTVTATGVTITPTAATHDANGNIEQVWTISLTDAALTNSRDYLTFLLANKYDLTNAYRNFKVTPAPKLPIEYVAPYNMASTTAFATDNTPEKSMYFSWNNSTANTNGVGTVAWTSAKNDIKNFINGTAVPGYHLPSKAEWCSIVAPYYAQTTDNKDTSMGGDTGIRIVYKNGQHTGLTETVAWGVTNASGTYTYDVNQVFYNDYNCPNDGAHETIGYGLRFKDDASTNGEYTCAYRYEYKASDATVGGTNHASLTIKVTYVGADAGVTIATISNESWWATCDYTLVLPACGYSNYTNGTNQNPGYYSSAASPARGSYWSATPRDASRVWSMSFVPSHVVGNDWNRPGGGFSVRLFADKD